MGSRLKQFYYIAPCHGLAGCGPESHVNSEPIFLALTLCQFELLGQDQPSYAAWLSPTTWFVGLSLLGVYRSPPLYLAIEDCEEKKLDEDVYFSSLRRDEVQSQRLRSNPQVLSACRWPSSPMQVGLQIVVWFCVVYRSSSLRSVGYTSRSIHHTPSREASYRHIALLGFSNVNHSYTCLSDGVRFVVSCTQLVQRHKVFTLRLWLPSCMDNVLNR